MKTLLLMRHAKSSWKEPTRADFDRPLSRRGRKAAQRMGRLMLAGNLLPNAILCSPAARSRETCLLLQQEWTFDRNVDWNPALYHCPATRLCEILRTANSAAECLLVIGHNPGLADFLFATVQFEESFPTGALAQLSVELDSWSEFHPETVINLEDIWRPREVIDP